MLMTFRGDLHVMFRGIDAGVYELVSVVSRGGWDVSCARNRTADRLRAVRKEGFVVEVRDSGGNDDATTGVVVGVVETRRPWQRKLNYG